MKLVLVHLIKNIKKETQAGPGFGGTYEAGSTDSGAEIIYRLALAGLFLSSAGLCYGIDRRLTPALGASAIWLSAWFVRDRCQGGRQPVIFEPRASRSWPLRRQREDSAERSIAAKRVQISRRQ
jgi:hypothetical protein